MQPHALRTCFRLMIHGAGRSWRAPVWPQIKSRHLLRAGGAGVKHGTAVLRCTSSLDLNRDGIAIVTDHDQVGRVNAPHQIVNRDTEQVRDCDDVVQLRVAVPLFPAADNRIGMTPAHAFSNR